MNATIARASNLASRVRSGRASASAGAPASGVAVEQATYVRIEGEPRLLTGVWVLTCVLGLLTSLAIAGASLSMLELGPIIPVLATALVVALAEGALALNASACRGANIAALAAVVIALVMRPGRLYDGLPLVLNRAFQLSSQHQAYVYEMFPVGLDGAPAEAALTVGLCFLVGIAAAIACFSLSRGSAAGVIAVVAVHFALQAYLGVGAHPALNVALLSVGACVASLCHVRRRGYYTVLLGRTHAVAAGIVLVAAAVGVLVALVFALYPASLHDDNPVVHEANEVVRDSVAGGEGVAGQFTMLVSALLQGGSDSDGSSQSSESSGADSEGGGNVAEHAAPASLQAVSVLESWQLLLLLLAVAVAVLVCVYLVKRRLVRGKFDSPDSRVAIDAQFRHIVRRLKLYGLKSSNRAYLDMVPDVESLGGADLAQRFRQATTLWEESRYSSAPVPRQRVAEMRGHLTWVCQAINDAGGPWVRIREAILCYNKN